ncbi:unnamed protein product [Prunus armeniaca]|uniref:Uncharacterized protein n=1 Tax=Prunus armeniaca TaxID=36596 RepID=A0A6J5WKR7_PRUAR|nr:unnamed protein product [Prunus armeniaca]
MLPILQKYFSLTFLKEGLAEQIAVDKSHSAHRINPGPVDSALLKDCVAQVLVASNKRFIKIVHCYLLEAGKEKQAEEYLQKVFKVMEDMGLGTNPSSFFMPPAPPDVFPTPAPDWRPGQAMADGNDEAGIVPETEGSPSTAVEPNPIGLVLHVGEVTDRSMMDAAAEHKKKKGVMEVESPLTQTKHHPVVLFSFFLL